MLTVDVPDEVAVSIAAEAARLGTTAEELAVQYLRNRIAAAAPPGSLLEFLGPRVGSVAGTGEAFSQDTGRRFADGLAADRATGQ
jgi:hypothetical protein